jgi:GT2 family glycosyltransferase/glycosyltransferase involved in cell wall biosynthesis
VSVIVHSRDPQQLPKGLLDGLRVTDYPALELLVTRASDGPAIDPIAQLNLPFPVRVSRRDAEAGFAAATNDLAERSRQPLLLLLDDGAEPFEPGWLKELVDSVLSAAGGAVAATLLSPAAESGSASPESGFAVGHRGFVLRNARGVAQPVPVDRGSDVFAPGFGTDASRAAVSGACLLLDRESFGRAGGFDTGFRAGLQDVDLALSLGAAGERVACSGRAVVLHPAGPAALEPRLTERWGPALWRELRLGRWRNDRGWVGEDQLHVTIARAGDDAHAAAEASELGDALSALGLQVSHAESGDAPPDDADVAIALSPEFESSELPSWTTAVAWIRNAPDRWLGHPSFDRYDIVLAASQRAADAVSAATGLQPALFGPATNPRRFAPAAAPAEPASDHVLLGDRREDAAAVYTAAKVVIDDGAATTSSEDPLAGAVLDALACGTPVITNRADAARELFDGEFPVFSNAQNLRTQLDALLDDPARRRALALRYRRQVLSAHTYQHRARRLRELVRAMDERYSFCVKIGAPDWEQASRWGDLHLARDLARALKRRGHRSLIQVASEWNEPAGLAYDVALHLRGRSSYAPRPGQFNVLWLISHPEELSSDEANAFDLVCVASASFAPELRARLSVPVAVLDQATDPWRFYPDPDPTLAHELVFVGNSRGVRRHVLDDLLPTDHDLAVWGGGLKEIVGERRLQGEWFSNEQLRKVYSSAKLVLCDHWEDMREHGFASNRLYDAVASGAIVVTDAVSGLDGRFGEAVVTYESADQLRGTIERLLNDDEERARRVAGARERVAAAHTFDHRVAELLALVGEHAPGSGHRLRVVEA